MLFGDCFAGTAGDSVLAEFASVVEAVNCAVEIQTGLTAENESIPPAIYRSSLNNFLGSGSSNDRSFDCIVAHLPKS